MSLTWSLVVFAHAEKTCKMILANELNTSTCMHTHTHTHTHPHTHTHYLYMGNPCLFLFLICQNETLCKLIKHSNLWVRIRKLLRWDSTAWRLSKYGVFSGPYFPAFRLNAESYSIIPYSVRMRENTDQKNSTFRHFSLGVVMWLSSEGADL